MCGNTGYVDAYMKYNEWYDKYVKTENESSNKGKDKDARVDLTKEKPNEYRRKLDSLGENDKTTRLI